MRAVRDPSKNEGYEESLLNHLTSLWEQVLMVSRYSHRPPSTGQLVRLVDACPSLLPRLLESWALESLQHAAWHSPVASTQVLTFIPKRGKPGWVRVPELTSVQCSGSAFNWLLLDPDPLHGILP